MKCCDITPGMVRHSIVIQRSNKSANGSGGFIVIWADLLAAKAHVENKTGRETVIGDQIVAQRTVEFYFRYPRTVSVREGDRIIFRGLSHNIRYVNDIEYLGKWLSVSCEQGVAS